MARKMALFTSRLLPSWGDSMRGTFVVPQKVPIVACNGVDGVRSFAGSRKGKGLSRGQVRLSGHTTRHRHVI